MSVQCNFSLDRSLSDPVVVMIFESTIFTQEPLVSAELVGFRGARREVHNEIGFLVKTFEDCFRFLVAALNLELSKTLFTCLAQLDLAAPFGLEDLRSCDTAGRIGIEN